MIDPIASFDISNFMKKTQTNLRFFYDSNKYLAT